LVRAGFSLSFNEGSVLSVTVFNRNVDDAIILQPSLTGSGSHAVRILNVSQVRTKGVAGSLNLRYGPFALEGTALYQDYVESDTSKDLLPNLVLSGELSYRNKFFNEALDAKVGVRTHFMNRQRGMTFNPRMTLYEENTETNIGRWTRLDAFAILKIGNAYISLSYENLLNAYYMITPVYPMPERSFRLGVNWVFID
jgi:outer membrane cobalamin receptor